jgi:4-hydroxybenzoate polyprenyltransferase
MIPLETVWPYYLVTVVFGLAGLCVGNHIGKVVTPRVFFCLVICVLVLASLSMLLVPPFVLLFLVAVGVATLFGVAINELSDVAQEAENAAEKAAALASRKTHVSAVMRPRF